MGATLLAAILSSAAIVTLFSGIYVVVERPGSFANRLETYVAVSREKDARAAGARRGVTRLLALCERFLSGQVFTRHLALRLAQANAHLTLPEFAVITFVAGVGMGAVAFLVQGHLLSAVAGSLVGFLLPWLLLERKRHRRIKAFQDQLLDVLVLIVGSLRSGHAMPNAIELVSKELSAPASEEFSRVLREVGFGLSQTEALNNLVRRMESDDLQLIVTAVNISHESGGNLSQMLEKIAETIRERIQLHGEIRVLTTQQRLTTYLLVALPVLLGIAISLLSPRYMMVLFRPPWIAIPIGAGIFEVIGFFIARSLTRIEV